ncbi:hypothetical protein [Marinobacterium ramblicola]|uniref:DUF6812 domain-containing protein n=1 Tax=Marinobacterium ramblicola TaxID=2849041 RepID=UPI0031B9F444
MRKQKSEIKVYVRMHDGSRMLGNVFLAEGERLQDIMNDDRTFLPIHAEDQKSISVVMLSKRYIQQIEEVVADGKRDNEFYRRYDRRSADRDQDVQQERETVSGLKLELEEQPNRPVTEKKGESII